jgi:hypothetical protein
VGKSPSLAPQQLRTLGRLRELIQNRGLYLAGGVAVSLHVQHRLSLDLDLFSLEPDFDLARFRDEVVGLIRDARTLGLTDASLRMEIDGALVDVVSYPYRLLSPPSPGPQGVPVAGLLDLAAMKLGAVAQRGIRRDFWDLYEILHHGISCSDALSAYCERYGACHSDLYHVLRALTYFDDAEADTVFPRGLTVAEWSKIRSYFDAAVPALARHLLK